MKRADMLKDKIRLGLNYAIIHALMVRKFQRISFQPIEQDANEATFTQSPFLARNTWRVYVGIQADMNRTILGVLYVEEWVNNGILITL